MQRAAENPSAQATLSGQPVAASPDPAKTEDTRENNHLFAYRANSSLFGKRFYIYIVFGKEKRSDARLASEGRQKSFSRILMMVLSIAWMIFWVTVVLLGLGVVVLYLFKSGIGLNLFDGHFFLHDYFFD